MITDTYNRNVDTITTDNNGANQGVLSKKMIVEAHAVANLNQTPISKGPQTTSSFSKSIKRDDNPIAQEMVSDGLGALFGAATGLEWIEMVIDYGCDAVEFRDEYAADRLHHKPAPQPDPRLWMQPTPGYGLAA